MSKNVLGSVLLFLAALIWGSSFIIMKNATDFLTPAVLLSVRFVLAAIFLCVLFFKQIKKYPKNKVKGALLTGCCLFIAYYVQTWGLSFTTPGKNAFLTAIYCAIVPFLTWFLDKKRPDIYNFIAAFICIFGIGCVSLNGDLSVNIGDALTLGAGFLYAVHILMIQKNAEGVDAGAFNAIQFIGGAIVAVIFGTIFEDMSLVSQIQPSIFLQIFYLAFFATAMTMVFQTIGQKNTDQCSASIILSLESVFGVIFSVIFYGEVLTKQVILGFVLIFLAIIISETKLSFLKKKKNINIFIILLIVFTSFPVQEVKAKEDISLNAPFAYVYDLTTDQILYTKNQNEKIYPASMTKVMTALVALEHIENLETSITITQEDLKGLYEANASVAGFQVGEQVTYRDLIYGILLPSGADGCRATARVLFSGEEAMVEQMNQKAQELGLKKTHFENTTGLHDDNHYTTVQDMAIITKAALENETFKEIFTSRTYTTTHSGLKMISTLLKIKYSENIDVSHIQGCKTGYTSQAQSCITCLVNVEDQELLCVFAKEENKTQYVADAKTVLDYYKNKYMEVKLYQKDDILYSLPVRGGAKSQYDIKASDDICLFIDRTINKEDIELRYIGNESIEAPTQLNSNLGTIQFVYDDIVFKEISVLMEESIDVHIVLKLINLLKENILIVCSIIVLFIMFIFKRKMSH